MNLYDQLKDHPRFPFIQSGINVNDPNKMYLSGKYDGAEEFIIFLKSIRVNKRKTIVDYELQVLETIRLLRDLGINIKPVPKEAIENCASALCKENIIGDIE